ncbi:RelA/SpoT family protein [Pajaroellobacter abortibovis]|uniref:GTP pyrophosphokinase n=1 Tax=Pajaroellobacter abortibovis TaxID=1882918 RepID=A0A1L6MX15_9BACT|nr:bifunctional (p)ppGpp synthetase/guanosine-3',5'-bis(diphosphate) 3'-pyrophosphohydrolase [Pajaroellobacter abortibovis]APS00062.1 GTP pyrophosphokinase [Pajaroellobacter abortibovis]
MIGVEQIIEQVKGYQPNLDIDLIRRAYHFSHRVHQGQVRRSGEPYIVHPVGVAAMIAELKLDSGSVCAALLHDVVEDTLTTMEEIEREFNTEIASLVDGVTKLSKINFTSKQDREAENFRKMVVAMSRDIRVLLIKLCDRMDNMRTLQYMQRSAQERIARETLDIYAPLAHRLGIQSFKNELEDLAFKYLEPEIYETINTAFGKTKEDRDRYIARVCETFSTHLKTHGLKIEVSGRAKNPYSIWRKMQMRKVGFDQINDLIAFRVITENTGNCYAALGMIHAKWTPLPGRFKDHIAIPKSNMYQSLHTTVIGPGGQRIEVQIRTQEMHHIAEHGIASHWLYKDGHTGGNHQQDIQRFEWLRQLVELQKDLKDPAEFLEGLKFDLFQDEVYVFTPKGDVRVFPMGATPIDFAYGIHSEIGNHLIGAKIDGKLNSLRYKLRNGDVVEIITSPHQQPSRDWLDYVVTTRARSKIRSSLRQGERERSRKLGQGLLEKEFQKSELSFHKLLKSSNELQKLFNELKVQSINEVFIGIGYGKIDPTDIVRFFEAPANYAEGVPLSDKFREDQLSAFIRKVVKKEDGGIQLNGIDDILVRYAKCCSPLPGDEILGFITRGRGVTVHRQSCSKAFDTDPERRVEVQWGANPKINCLVHIRIIAVDQSGILAHVGRVFLDERINITEANCRTHNDEKSINIISFHCSSLEQLKRIIRAVQKIKGVLCVERI